ncbi:MAG: response regulator, partial [Nocardioides sp.]
MPASQAPSPRLLVVDDEPNIRELLSASLRFAGFEVTAVGTGHEAVAAAASGQPDLVVLDVMLPDLDGFEVLRRVKADAGTAAVPVIILTALDSERSRQEGSRCGAA